MVICEGKNLNGLVGFSESAELMQRLASLNSRFQGFGVSIFSEMTKLARERGSCVNLGQGFPNFSGEAHSVLHKASEAILSNKLNQYARSFGEPVLVNAIAEHYANQYSLEYSPEEEVTVFSGATEAIFASFASLLEVMDEVIVFEPCYDSYRPSINVAGGRERVCMLRYDSSQGRFTFDRDELASLMNPRTKCILLNSPHNPTGTVFTRQELMYISSLCLKQSHECIVISDEVYEKIVFDDSQHTCIASLPGMQDRTIVISSAGKTYSVTGWKIGWACAPPHLTKCLRTAHQYITFASATPFQYAVGHTLMESQKDDFFKDLRNMYQEKRDRLSQGLSAAGFNVLDSQGTYFVQVDVGENKNDVQVCRELIENAGVVTIPSSAFYIQNRENRYLRFAFCKTDDVLDDAVRRLIQWREQSSGS